MVEAAVEYQELDDERRPYAPAANVIAVLERLRRLKLPDVVNADILRIAGVSEGAMGRVLQALRFLRLIDATGRPTDRLGAIARAGDDEWRDLLAGVVREAYASDFARIDPAQDPQQRIVSAFKRYEPRSQTDRMVMLFLGLARAAGIPVLDAPRERLMQPSRAATGRTPTVAKSSASRAASATRASAPLPTDSLQQPIATNLLFGVTVDDIAALPEADFKAVWDALGKVAQARARNARRLPEEPEVGEGE